MGVTYAARSERLATTGRQRVRAETHPDPRAPNPHGPCHAAHGRGAEKTLLGSLLERAHAGAGSVLVLHGEIHIAAR